MPRAIALFSGGLDSMLAVRIMQRQGFDVHALHIRTVFPCCRGEVAQAAAALDVPLSVISVAEDYVELLRHPRFGYGKGLNPCVDCRITMCRMAQHRMQELQAALVITGEVLGQRPMSQKRRDLDLIAHHSGLQGRLLRPLSARLLPATVAECEGLVDRNQLYGFVGQGRRPQLELAAAFGIPSLPGPSTGCVLAEPLFADRVRQLFETQASVTRWDLELLSGAGRQMESSGGCRVVVGRNAHDNGLLMTLAARSDARNCTLLQPIDFAGPTALVVGPNDAAATDWAAREIVRRSRGVDRRRAHLRIESAAGAGVITVEEESL